jgi:esterase/lipase superfamily enzyme
MPSTRTIPPLLVTIVLMCAVGAPVGGSVRAQDNAAFQKDFRACKSPPSEKEVGMLKADLRKYEVEARAIQTNLKVKREKDKIAAAAKLNLRTNQSNTLRTMERLECANLLKLPDPVNRASATVPTFLEAPVSFATDRVKDASQASKPTKDPYTYFTGKLDPNFTEFSFGTVTVTIPTNRRPGELTLPPFWKVIGRNNPAEYFQLLGIQDMDREALLRDLADARANPDSSILLFVHGFNVTFSEGALRAAQLAHDLSFPGRVFLYSWPSVGNIQAYWTDEDSARISTPRFGRLLADLSRTGIKRIYIVAHSMGTRLVIPSVNNLRTSGGDLTKVSALLLAAADFNQIEFKDIAGSFAQMRQTGANVTIYAASNDFALKISKVIHSYRRLGESDPLLDIYAGLDSIDASTAAPMRRAFGHAYVSDSAQVVGDMQDVILKRLNPAQRGLEPIPNTSDYGWRIPRLR